MKKALFLDRDGVINKDFNYVHKIENFEFIDGVFDAIRFYQEQGYLPVVITNQSGIGRGYYTSEQFDILTKWMIEEFENSGIKIAKVYHCPHNTDEDCSCRKPLPGMLKNAQVDLNIDLKNSILVGDKESDIEAGIAAGLSTLFLVSEKLPEKTAATYVVKSLFDTIKFFK